MTDEEKEFKEWAEQKEREYQEKYRGCMNTLCGRFTIFDAQMILDALEIIDPIEELEKERKSGLIWAFRTAIQEAKEADSTEDIEIMT